MLAEKVILSLLHTRHETPRQAEIGSNLAWICGVALTKGLRCLHDMILPLDRNITLTPIAQVDADDSTLGFQFPLTEKEIEKRIECFIGNMYHITPSQRLQNFQSWLQTMEMMLEI